MNADELLNRIMLGFTEMHGEIDHTERVRVAGLLDDLADCIMRGERAPPVFRDGSHFKHVVR